MKKEYCYIIDSGLQVIKVKQSKMQELLSNKDIAPLDINEIVGSEDITDLIEYLLVEYKLYNKYDIQFIIDHLNDCVCELESEKD